MKNLNKIMNMDSVYLRRLYNTSCMAFRTENRFARKGGVVFVGDSITDFCNLDTYYPGLKAFNRGISGDTIEGIRGRLDESVFGLSPSLVVLHGGANNFADGYEDVETFIIDTYRDILSQIKSRLPQTKVLVQSVYPVSDVSFHNRYKFGHGHIEAINGRLRELTQSFGYDFADVYSVITSGDEEFDSRYTDDGLHPNKEGFRVISEYLRPQIDALLGKHAENNDVLIIHGRKVATSLVERMLIILLGLAMGVLFCVNISAAVSITLGVMLCVYGIINIIIIGISRRPLFSVMGAINGAIVAIGIAFCTHDLATVVALLIPFVLTIVGTLMLVDSIVSFFLFRHGGLVRLGVLALFGAATSSLGLSLLTNEGFRLGYTNLVFGIILSVASLTLLAFTIADLSKNKSK